MSVAFGGGGASDAEAAAKARQTIRTERVKLTATAVNNLAVASVAGSMLIPAINTGEAPTGRAVSFAMLGLVLHVIGQGILGRLR